MHYGFSWLSAIGICWYKLVNSSCSYMLLYVLPQWWYDPTHWWFSYDWIDYLVQFWRRAISLDDIFFEKHFPLQYKIDNIPTYCFINPFCIVKWFILKLTMIRTLWKNIFQYLIDSGHYTHLLKTKWENLEITTQFNSNS